MNQLLRILTLVAVTALTAGCASKPAAHTSGIPAEGGPICQNPG
jgi:type IV pilus biogenesis protein CpaD/CtpE